jgi:HD-like signal output (HDOD) protein
MAAKLLQVVNSAFFGVGRRVANPEEAATLLGMETLKGLVLVTGIFHQFKSSPPGAPIAALEHLWPHSLSVGRLARDIAKGQLADKTVVEDAMTAGLLHNIGMMLLAANSPSSWDQVQKRLASGEIPLWEVIRQVTGESHNALGAYLLGLWGLPEPVVEAVAFYHQPSRQACGAFSALTAVHVADALIHDAGRLNEDYLSALGLSDRIPEWRALARPLTGDTDP